MADPPPPPHPSPPPEPRPAIGIPVDHAHEHPEAHEHSDVNVRALFIALAIIAAVAIAVHIFLYFLLGAFSGRQARSDDNVPRSAVAAPDPGPPPGVPRLQGVQGFHAPTPRQDMQALAARNRIILSTYGPGAEPGRVRIPIDRAIDLALERGLFPTSSPPPPGPDQPAPPQEGGTDADR